MNKKEIKKDAAITRTLLVVFVAVSLQDLFTGATSLPWTMTIAAVLLIASVSPGWKPTRSRRKTVAS